MNLGEENVIGNTSINDFRLEPENFADGTDHALFDFPRPGLQTSHRSVTRRPLYATSKSDDSAVSISVSGSFSPRDYTYTKPLDVQRKMTYGHVPRPAGSDPSSLRPRLYALPQRAQTAERQGVVVIPFNAEGVEQARYASGGPGDKQALRPPKGLIEYLAGVFNAELERGVTYPQRGPMDSAEFEGYFLGYDLLVAFFLSSQQLSRVASASIPDGGLELDNVATLPDVSGLDYEKDVAGFYYIKPNYPGRSSHLCNAGFVVPPPGRGLGLGGVLGRSFLHFAPKAGYKGSVFNLVYVNNMASVKIWQKLGFTIVGRLPMAGLLKTDDGKEELTDAFIIFKDFTGTVQDASSAEPKPLPTHTEGGTQGAV